MEVGIQTNKPKKPNRTQKKRQKMAAKQEAKRTGVPIPKEPKVYRPRRKTSNAAKPVVEYKPTKSLPTVARTHIELYKLMEEERNLQITPEDAMYPEKPACMMEFYVSNNAKHLDAALEFPDEIVTFLSPKKSCPELFKMLSGIGMKAIVIKSETRMEGPRHLKSLRIFIYDKDKNPVFRYTEAGELPNVLENGSVRTTEVPLIIDIIATHDDRVKLYLTSIDGTRMSASSCFIENDIQFDFNEATVTFAKDIEYTLRCALSAYLQGKLYEVAKEYFEGDTTAVYLPARIIG